MISIFDGKIKLSNNLKWKIHGVSSLYVADNSALPYIGAENQILTTIALA
ncbi:GMC oxidoreductase [Paenibacillus sp. V4I5]|nr:GMC oxidoreductase [Paenibacillus sp. V4I5]MDQ0916252.1 choline dehydrogenase-like flavoprotein [Paenibacillus sp. V4I5]